MPQRVVTMDLSKKEDHAEPAVFINPEIVEISDESQTGDEGCLSFPNIFVPVKRGMRARVRAMDLDGQTFEVEGEGLYARARSGQIPNFTGINSPYEPPENPEVVLDTMRSSPAECVDLLICFLRERGIL